jgi:hypothetical protein
MKIAIGINTYNSQASINKRQEFCIESLRHIKTKYTNVTLCNIQFDDDKYDYDCFDKTVYLNRSSNNLIINPVKKFPITLDIFDILAQQNCDYFIFLNDDIILLPRIIKIIQEQTYDCYVASRVDIEMPNNIKDELKLVSYNIHGFDCFCISTNWWRNNRQYFPPLILGKYFWDVYFYSLCKMLGNTKTLNTLPPVALHPIHNGDSSDNTMEHQYNELLAKNVILQLWFHAANYILTDRVAHSNIKNSVPTKNEDELLDTLYKTFYEKNLSYLRR